MEHTRLKDNTKTVLLALAVGVFLITILIGVAVQLDERTEDIVDGCVWTVFGIIQVIILLRTGNRALWAWTILCFLIAGSYFTGYKGIYFIIPVVALLLLIFYFVITTRLTWKYRNILQLAADTVDQAEDGFTPRPYPLREISTTPEELTGFGKFLSANLIAFPFQDESGLYLCINESGQHWFKRPTVDKDTYIHFPEQGPVAVNIARKEYDRYEEELTFDRLCQSLGDLFVRFLELYREGKTEDIINITAGR